MDDDTALYSFSAKFEVDPETQCWVWTAYKNKKGYGFFCVNGKTYRSHRWLWERAVGEIPAGMHLDHLCRNTACVNPDHLEPVTPAENTRRKVLYATCKRGHQMDGNRYIDKRGASECAICRRERKRRWRMKKALQTVP